MGYYGSKVYDEYGNLLTNIFMYQYHCKINSKEYNELMEEMKEEGNFHKERYGDIFTFTSGYQDNYLYDENNNMIIHICTGYSANSIRSVERYEYIYNEDQLMMQSIRYTEGETGKDSVEVVRYKYDKLNNITDQWNYTINGINIYSFSLNDIDLDSAKSNIYKSHYQYINEYNEKDQLISVTRPESDMTYEYTYPNNDIRVEKTYSRSRLLCTIYQYYKGDFKYKEEFYSETNILLKIINYEKKNNRIARKLISPARDEFKWYLQTFEQDEVTLYIKEPIITPALVESIYRYIVAHKTTDSYFNIRHLSHFTDSMTFGEELNEISKYYFEKHKIIIRYF